MNGVTVLTMLTMAEVVGVTVAELVQAFGTWSTDRQPPRGSKAVARNRRPPSVGRLAAPTPLLPTARLGMQEEG